jgi:hypothetical protein
VNRLDFVKEKEGVFCKINRMNKVQRINVTTTGHILGRTWNTWGIKENGKIRFLPFHFKPVPVF